MKQMFVVETSDMPSQIYASLLKQKPHIDLTSSSGESVSVLADVKGEIYLDSYGFKHFRAAVVSDIQAADAKYTELWEKSPPPISFEVSPR